MEMNVIDVLGTFLEYRLRRAEELLTYLKC